MITVSTMPRLLTLLLLLAPASSLVIKSSGWHTRRGLFAGAGAATALFPPAARADGAPTLAEYRAQKLAERAARESEGRELGSSITANSFRGFKPLKADTSTASNGATDGDFKPDYAALRKKLMTTGTGSAAQGLCGGCEPKTFAAAEPAPKAAVELAAERTPAAE